MKVLHLYSGNLFGGIETLLITLSRKSNLCHQIEPHFALCFDGKLADALRASNVEVHQIGYTKTSKPWTILSARRQLRLLLKRQKFDVVICHSFWVQAIFAPVVQMSSAALVFWCHDIPKGKHWIERWAKLTKPDLVIANSRCTLKTISKLYKNVRTELLYCPVESSISKKSNAIRRKIRRELKTPVENVVIVQTSRLDWLKGQHNLIQALGRLKKLENWTLWIAGGVQREHEENYLNSLKHQAIELGIHNQVHFLGHRSDVPELLTAADIYCQPNAAPDAFGIAFIEALYAGLPVVTTDIGGGGPEIVDDSCGILVPPESPESLSDALRTLIIDDIYRQRLAVGGPKRAKDLCDPSQQIARLHQIFEQLTKSLVVA